jgi:hypothetical protein
VSVRGGSRLEITGGEYEGDNGVNMGGLSISIDGIGSQVDVYGGSYRGDWYIGAWAKMYLFGCDFTINGNVVKGFLSDDTALDVIVKANGLLFFVDECPDIIGGVEEQVDIMWSSGFVSYFDVLQCF